MKLILLTADDCDICHEAEEKFKKEFEKELYSGEAEVVNLDQDEEAQEIWLENDLPLAPVVLLITDKNKVISHIETKDLLAGLKEASPAAAEAVKAAVESSG
jgi:glutaredoxin